MNAIVETKTETMIMLTLENGMQLVASPEQTFGAAEPKDSHYKDTPASKLTLNSYLRFGRGIHEERITDIEYVKIEKIVG